MLGRTRFQFLNKEGEVKNATDWNSLLQGKLWLYNLHYFDDLTASDAADRTSWHLDIILRWIDDNPAGQGNGWEPYPISLRIVNWIKWALSGNELPPEALFSLAVQTRFLRKRLEYHLLGNHLFANAKALIFSGIFFAGEEAEVWLKSGLEILYSEILEQVLPDGGHFERSPMYHAIILEDLLDLVNVMQAYGQQPAACIEVIGRMRRWLNAMVHPDGEIVLFNDAAFGVATPAAELENYADRLSLNSPPLGERRPVVHLPETGYMRLQRGDAVAFLDVARIGPDYLPGHAHADTLNFELSLFGRRVIVDSGTSTYEKNEERQRQRGTAAHNTVCIDGQDSSEVWAAFRVARRAYPVGLRVEEARDEVLVACGHDGYRRLKGKPVHRREWRFSCRNLMVLDQIDGKFGEALARYHFHPDVDIEMVGERTGRALLPGGGALKFRVARGSVRLVDATYSPEFNTVLPCRCLEVRLDGPSAAMEFVWG